MTHVILKILFKGILIIASIFPEPN